MALQMCRFQDIFVTCDLHLLTQVEAVQNKESFRDLENSVNVCKTIVQYRGAQPFYA
jgi:hypothetical protein